MLSLPQIDLGGLLGGKKFFIVVGLVVLVLLVVAGLLVSSFLAKAKPVTITMWGMWEPESVYQIATDDYKRKNPNVTVKYVKQSPINFRERAMTAITRDGGPDIVTLHNSWLPMVANGLVPATTDVYPASRLGSDFYPVATRDFVLSGKVYALPLEYDGLGLYVNQDLFNAAGVSLPTTWEEFRAAAARLTVRDQNGRIKTAGAAMGGVANIDHWQDIVSLMMLQAGVNMVTGANSQAAVDALSYYTTFETSDRVWDETLDSSTLAFAKGTVAMYFAPSWRFFDIKSVNAELNFKVIPVPQLNGGRTVNLASYWGAGVSKKSVNTKVAWDFLKFLTSEEELTKMYAAEAKLRNFGEPYPRQSMATLLSAEAGAGSFVLGAPTAESSYLVSNTNDGDTGINSRISKYYQDAVNSMVRGSDAKSVLDTVAKGVEQVLSTYTGK